ncbi:expressed protein [Echinococcus multilocularis]|uniref:Expressed protein n=1 Tax=Echinococcus multilocularis TaxID=6211 RepID=A0A068YJR1_ECHMU|nr:expressed protein [Echinococcus multilocularis]
MGVHSNYKSSASPMPRDKSLSYCIAFLLSWASSRALPQVNLLRQPLQRSQCCKHPRSDRASHQISAQMRGYLISTALIPLGSLTGSGVLFGLRI